MSGVGTADQDGVLVVTVTGDLDAANFDTVREALGATLKETPTGVVLNLAVKFIASGTLEMTSRNAREPRPDTTRAGHRAARRRRHATGGSQPATDDSFRDRVAEFMPAP